MKYKTLVDVLGEDAHTQISENKINFRCLVILPHYNKNAMHF